jgi:hypothetical protein
MVVLKNTILGVWGVGPLPLLLACWGQQRRQPQGWGTDAAGVGSSVLLNLRSRTGCGPGA